MRGAVRSRGSSALVRLERLAAGLVLLAACSARAQETRETDFPELEQKPGFFERVRVRLTADNRFLGPADFGAFEATSNQPEGRIRVDLPLAENVGMRVQGTGRMIRYDLSGPSSLAGSLPDGDAFRDLYSWDLRFQGVYLLDPELVLFSPKERWALLAQGGVGAKWEEGSSMSAGLRPTGALALGYRWRDRLELAAGVSVSESLFGDGVDVGPLLQFEWRIDSLWKIRSYGLGLQIERRLGDSWTLLAQGRLEGRSFRLADRGAGIGAGALRLRQLPIGVGAQWTFGILRVRAMVGGVFLHRIELSDQNGDRVDRESAIPSPYLTLRVDLKS